jgi:hypothetical protein
MNEKIVIKGGLESSKRVGHPSQISLDKAIATIKFRRTIRRLIKLIKSK